MLYFDLRVGGDRGNQVIHLRFYYYILQQKKELQSLWSIFLSQVFLEGLIKLCVGKIGVPVSVIF